MVLLNIYGKIQPVIISKKLGVGISNLPIDWVNGLQDDLVEEILIHNHHIKSYEKKNLNNNWVSKKYDLKQMVKKLGWLENGKKATQIIAENLIEIKVSAFHNSLLQIKNQHISDPTCEPQYARKFLNLCYKVQSSNNAKKIIPDRVPFSIYNSDDFNDKPRILSDLQFSLNPHPFRKFQQNARTIGGIKSLMYLGKLIDKFLISIEDFWLLDYIINAIFSDDEPNTYHIFKVVSLIEMLIINPSKKMAGEIEQKLPQFLSDNIEASQHVLFAEIIRKLRNKIGHGDFNAVQKLLWQYQHYFMKNFCFDECEYSIENWIYNSICLRLDETLNEILWLMISDRDKLVKIQKA